MKRNVCKICWHSLYVPDSDVEVAGVVVVNSKNCRHTHSKLVFILSILLVLGMMKKNNLPKIWAVGAVIPIQKKALVFINLKRVTCWVIL